MFLAVLVLPNVKNVAFQGFQGHFFFCGNADKFIVGPHVIENETLANGNDSSLVPRACTFSLFFFETFFFPI